ncbi:unnamed protein product, partial [Symbiodinium sp. CCMP2456]
AVLASWPVTFIAFALAGRVLFGAKADEVFSELMMHFSQSLAYLPMLAPYLTVMLDRSQKEQDTNMKRIDAD